MKPIEEMQKILLLELARRGEGDVFVVKDVARAALRSLVRKQLVAPDNRTLTTAGRNLVAALTRSQ